MKKIIFFMFFCITPVLLAQSNDGYLTPFSEDKGGVQYFGYKNAGGEIIISAKYRIVNTDRMYKMAIVQRDDGQWVGIDRNEKILLYPFIYENGPDFVFEGLFRIVENDKIGFANLNGDIVIAPQFDYADSFKDGLAEFALGGHEEYAYEDVRWAWTGATETGYINKRGQRFIRILKTLDDEKIAWTKSGKSFYIDDKGNIIKEVEVKKESEE